MLISEVIPPFSPSDINKLLVFNFYKVSHYFHTSIVFFAIAMFSSLHVLYIIRPSFGLMGAVFFFFSSAYIILGGSLADKKPIFAFGDYVATPCLFAGVVVAIMLLVFRRWIGHIWDVSLKIRPLVRLNYDNRSSLRKIYDGLKDYIYGE